MNYNTKVLILFILLVFALLYPSNTRAMPLCQCFEDVDCGPGYYCDETVTCVSYEEGVFGGMCRPCECYNYGSGWHDAPFWGGCDDCNLNSQNWCGPCGEAKAFCDGCLWNDTWNPFRDETYPGSYGHKCPGNPPVCASGQTECRSGETIYECDSNRCGWHLKEGCDDSDGCYAYDNGCEERNYSCSNGNCTYSASNQHADSYDSYENYCSDTILRKHRLFHDWYCDSVICKDHTIWKDDQLVQNCGSDYCENWYVCGCDGNYIKECRVCHSQGCNNGNCYDNPSTEERKTTNNCDDSDGCVGTTYRDYSCSNDNCVYTDSACDSRCDSPPNIPTLTAPFNNTWINYNPTFQATVSDPDDEDVRAYFNISGYGDGWGNWTNSGNISEWGPVNLGNCTTDGYWWQVQAENKCGFKSDLSGYWKVKADKDPPSSSISYPTGTIDYVDFAVTLDESDDCSQVAQGNVDISIDGDTWQAHTSTIDTFNYTGSNGHCYKFRYQVQDSAGNLSSWAEGKEVCIGLCQCSSEEEHCCSNNCNFDSSSIVCQLEAEEEFQCSNTDCGGDYQRRTRDRYCSGSAATCTGDYGSWSEWSTVEDCTDLQFCSTSSPYCQDDSSCAPPAPPPQTPPAPTAPPAPPPQTPPAPTAPPAPPPVAPNEKGEGGFIEIKNPLKAENIQDIIKSLTGILKIIAVGVGFVMVIWSGIMIMTASGNEEQLKKGKKTLMWTIIGVAIVILVDFMVGIIKEWLGA